MRRLTARRGPSRRAVGALEAQVEEAHSRRLAREAPERDQVQAGGGDPDEARRPGCRQCRTSPSGRTALITKASSGRGASKIPLTITRVDARTPAPWSRAPPCVGLAVPLGPPEDGADDPLKASSSGGRSARSARRCRRSGPRPGRRSPAGSPAPAAIRSMSFWTSSLARRRSQTRSTISLSIARLIERSTAALSSAWRDRPLGGRALQRPAPPPPPRPPRSPCRSPWPRPRDRPARAPAPITRASSGSRAGAGRRRLAAAPPSRPRYVRPGTPSGDLR